MALDHETELAVTSSCLVDTLEATATTPAVAVAACVEAAIQLTERHSAEPMTRAEAIDHLLKTLAEQRRGECHGVFS